MRLVQHHLTLAEEVLGVTAAGGADDAEVSPAMTKVCLCTSALNLFLQQSPLNRLSTYWPTILRV